MKLFISILSIIVTIGLAQAESNLAKSAKKVNIKKENLVQLINPFAITKEEKYQKLPAYSQRLLDAKDVNKITSTINKFQEHADNLNKTIKDKNKQPGPVLKYKQISYIKQKKVIRLFDVEDESLNIYKDIDDKVDITKQIDFLWFDFFQEDPYFLRAIITDNFILKDSFLKTDKGKELFTFLTKLKAGEKLNSKQLKRLNNVLEIAYEFDPKQNSLNILLDLNFDRRLQVKIVAKFEQYTKLMHHQLLYPSIEHKTDSLLPLISTLKIKNLYIKLQLKDSINDIANALDKKEGQDLMNQYKAYKQVPAQDWQKRYFNMLTIEQTLAYKQAIINFVEYKQPLILQFNLEKAEQIPTLVSFVLLAVKNPQVMALMIKTLNLTITNK
ncbi:MAG: hypothetical protein HQL46_04320 [Gammaproteobacteria bacterium]|nr:hypothetical protein [Gammaproteobacteria bacterium]